MEFLPILTVFVLVIGSPFPVQAVNQMQQPTAWECTTYPEGVPGKCISLKDCPRLNAIWQQANAGQTDGIDTLRKSVCATSPILLCCESVPTVSLGHHRELDDLAPNEVWYHLLLQLHRPYEDRLTSYKGDNNYVYLLENEHHIESSTNIIVPIMEEFTATGKGRFTELFRHSKGRGVIPDMFRLDVKEAVHELHDIYKKNPGAKGILKVAVNAKDHVNEYLHMHTLMHAIIHDKELHGFELPAFYDVFPEFFTKSGGDCNAPGAPCCQVKEYPRDLSEDEWKISYFREQAGFNDFHGSWHLYNTRGRSTPLNHGELFFYFHNQLLARYNMERLSNGLEPTTPLDNWDSSYLIPQNYIPPVLTHFLTRCADRSAGALGKLSTFNQILEHDISTNTLMLNNSQILDIKNDDGIKYVGCALERAECGKLSYRRYGPHNKNNKFYGIHNNGHIFLSKLGCDGNHMNTLGVMSDTWTAVRDPLFFRWHKFIDNVFQSHKKKLDEYSISQLALDGVSVRSIDVHSIRNEGELFTFTSTANLTNWFSSSSSTCFIQPSSKHFPFNYEINVDNYGNDVEVNLRIYLAPKNSSLNFDEQRIRWALMDRFKYTLKPRSNTIRRDSCSSSITVPPHKSFQELLNIYKDASSYNKFIVGRSKSAKCQCGLPEHLLLPRGTPEGMPYQLFVYITPRDNKQFQDQPSDCPDLECSDLCSKDYTGCLHSDSEPMGFPFDRPLTNLDGTGIHTTEDLDYKLPNAMLHDIKIFYNKDEKRFTDPNIRMCDYVEK